MLDEQGESDAVGKMKQFATYFTHGVRMDRNCAWRFTALRALAAILEIVDQFFGEQLEAPSAESTAECAAV